MLDNIIDNMQIDNIKNIDMIQLGPSGPVPHKIKDPLPQYPNDNQQSSSTRTTYQGGQKKQKVVVSSENN